ncbi:MAG: hypothetical protein PHY47_00260 [Lachnospiraceae bacterium]|nr:hypothetical protein [Lachnospiraceae bacterium]
MAFGVIRWRDIQNLFVTEDQINLLAGLTATSADLNRITGLNYNGTQLNQAYESVALLNNHLNKHLASAHTILANSIDGGALADSTVTAEKLNFDPLTQADNIRISNSIEGIETVIGELSTQIDNLYSIVLPGQANDIANSISEMVAHIEKNKDAHDATAISFGNQYTATMNTIAGSQQTRLSLDDIRFVKLGDLLSLQSTTFGPEDKTVTNINYNTGHIGFDSPAIGDYRIADTFIIHVRTQDNIQEAIHRSLRNTTDTLDGRLTINQDGEDSALVINNTGTNYLAQFNDFSAKTNDSFTIELGKANNASVFELTDSNARLAFQVTDQGLVYANTYSLEDRTSLYEGQITKQGLTEDRTWILPNRTGYIGIGDLTFTDLLKVKVDNITKMAYIAPGFSTNYEGQKIAAWISMDYPCEYAGGSFNLQARLQGDGQLLTLQNKWQVLVIYIDDSNTIGFQYGPQKTIKEEAIAEYENFIPSAFMKLAKIIVQGDNNGGILSSSIEILEDQRPFLHMGMSTAHYDETIVATNGLAAGSIITLPPNSRGGGAAMTYRQNKAQLEVYVDGVYQMVMRDYEEYQGTPVGRIRLLKPIATDSKLRFRITFKAAAVAGGVDTDTLQSVYMAGPQISLTEVVGPIKMMSYDLDVLLDITGDMILAGIIKSLRGLEFTPQTGLPGPSNKNQLYVNDLNKLIFHQYHLGTTKSWDLLEEIQKAQSAIIIDVINNTGLPIVKGSAVALHPSLNNNIVLCDTSNNLSTSRVLGVTIENIGSGDQGRIILAGNFTDSGLMFGHKTILVVDPRNPGLLVDRDSVTFLPNDQYQEVGIVNGGNLIVSIDRDRKDNKSWKKGIAGEAFEANKTKVVRLALNGETRGSIYKAFKENANMMQKFWAFAAVQPKQNVVAGEPIELYLEIDLAPGEVPFDDEDIGLPLYLANDGSVKSWRTIKGTYGIGDAIVKIGYAEDRRKFIIKDVQMMGTASGPME